MLQSPNAIVLKSIKELSRAKILKRTQSKFRQRDQLEQILHMFSNKSKFNMDMDYSFERNRSKTEQSDGQSSGVSHKDCHIFKAQNDLSSSNAVQKIVEANSMEFTLLGHKSKSLHFKNYLQPKQTFAQKKARLLSINIPNNGNQANSKLDCLNTLSNLKVNTALFLKKIQKSSPKKLLESKLRRFAVELSPISDSKCKISSILEQSNEQQKCIKKLDPIYDNPLQKSRSKFKQRLIKMQQISKNIVMNIAEKQKQKQQKLKRSRQCKGNKSKGDLTPWQVPDQQQFIV